jgi:hypothetical protein
MLWLGPKPGRANNHQLSNPQVDTTFAGAYHELVHILVSWGKG